MKTSQIFPLLLLTILSVNCTDTQQKCSLAIDQVDIQILGKNVMPCLQKALRNGWQTVTDYLVRQKKEEYKEQFIGVFQKQLKRLQILQQQIVLGTSETEPILKWGQNRTHVFISFKLSHRWDSPPCLYTQSQKSQLGTESFIYSNVCLVSHRKVSFKLNLSLYRSVFLSFNVSNNSHSSFETAFPDYVFQVRKDGVGTYSTILLKQTPQIWLFLTKQEKNYPTWHEIGVRYEHEFRQYQRSLATHKMIQRQKNASSSPPSQSFQPKTQLFTVLLLLIASVLFN